MQTKSNMNDCSTLRENLFAYSENELAPSLKERLDRHVAGCSTCSALVQQFNNVLAVVKEQSEAEPRPFAETRLQQRIDNYMESSGKPLFSFSIRTLLQPAIISLGMMLALAIGILIGSEKAGKHSNLANTTDLEMRHNLNIPENSNDDLISFTE